MKINRDRRSDAAGRNDRPPFRGQPDTVKAGARRRFPTLRTSLVGIEKLSIYFFDFKSMI
jgi:hypothetical protein